MKYLLLILVLQFWVILCNGQSRASNNNKVDCVKELSESIKLNYPTNMISVGYQNRPSNNKFKFWFSYIDKDSLAVFKLENLRERAMIYRSYDLRATGLASNMYSWLIFYRSRIYIFESLVKSPYLIFFNKKGILEYYSFSYNWNFVKTRDWNNVELDISEYQIENRKQIFKNKVSKFCK